MHYLGRMKKIVLLLALYTFPFAGVVHAQKEESSVNLELKLDEKGDLLGMPKKYAGTRFDIETLSFQRKNKAVVVPLVIADLF